MATFHQFRMGQYGLEAMPVKLYCHFNVGSSGAPTLVTADSKGIASVARNSAGDYTITFDQPFVSLLDVDCIVQNSTGISSTPNLGIKAQAVNSGPTVELVFSTGGTATDPANGDKVFMAFTLKNSNV